MIAAECFDTASVESIQDVGMCAEDQDWEATNEATTTIADSTRRDYVPKYGMN
jgi:hypothetical protein